LGRQKPYETENSLRLRDVTFANWLKNHREKDPEERWLRELYPWPVLAQADCDVAQIDRIQRIVYDGVEYRVILQNIRWQAMHGTYRYRIRVECDGLGWHSRSFSDGFDLCGTPDGSFVTLFHAKTEEPLEKMARAFFSRRWTDIRPDSFKTLAVSRFLAAAIVGQVAEEAFKATPLTHYPNARLIGGPSPMLASGGDLWIGYRFFSENAYEWARRSAGNASRVVALYFADTKYQFRTDLPLGTEVQSIAQLDATLLGGRHEDLIRTLLRGLELPSGAPDPEQLERIVLGHAEAPSVPVTEADVHEALAALKRPCDSKEELRYQLAAAVVLNVWIESERRLGFPQRKKFYAFKQKVESLARWVAETRPPGVELWVEALAPSEDPVLFLRVEEVDFSFHAIPIASRLLAIRSEHPTWKGVRLKPIAPLVLTWARRLRSPLPTKTSSG
jgi:hypothetical protein